MENMKNKLILFSFIIVLLFLPSCSKGKKVPIVENGSSEYKIIISQTASKEEREAAALIRSTIEKSTGVRLELSDDWIDEKNGGTPGEKEILVGKTNRKESTDALAELKLMSYAVCEIGGKIIICGRGDGAVSQAAEEFLTRYAGYNGKDAEVKALSVLSVKEGISIMNNMKFTSVHTVPEHGIITDSGMESDGYSLSFDGRNGGYSVGIYRDGKLSFSSETPAIIRILGKGGTDESEYREKYDNIVKTDGGYIAFAEIKTNNGSAFLVKDEYFMTVEGTFSFDRTVTVTESSPSDTGYASTVSFADSNGTEDRDRYDYFIPGVLYKDTSYMQTTNPWGASLASDFSGKRNYVKELCVTLPSSMARNRENGNYLMLVHLSPEINVEFPVGDDVIVNDEVRYGSVGYSFDSTLALDFVYPSSEGPVTYERDGAEWRRKYHSVKAGNSHSYSISLISGNSDNYSDAMVDSYKKAYSLYAPSVTADIDINKIYSQQIEIYRAFYTEYESQRGEKSAGVYFDASVRTGKPFSPISYLIGFSGAQTAAAYEMFREGVLSEDKDLIDKGIAMLDFWSSEKIVGGELPVVWWIPNEKAPLSGTVQNYANYLRVFVDGMESMLDACIFGEKNGYDISEWKSAALKTADFLVKNQSAEGTWARAYTRDGKPLKTVDELDSFNSSTIFNGYAGESPLASYCAVRFLYKAYQITGEEKYKTAAIRTAEWAYDALYLEIGKYVSICPDHVNICDKESAIYAMYCFSTAYEMTGDKKYQKALEHAAISAMSFVFVYDYAVPYSVSSAEYDGVNVFKNGGVIGQSLIATGYGHVDAYAAHTYYDFFDYYVLTGDSIYLDFAGFIQINTKLQCDYDGSKGWYLEGMNLEACYVSGNMFTTAGDGVWLPWVSHSFIAPVIDMRERYGDADVYTLSERYSREELFEMRG